jgi:dTDP-4-dehydrorhamnose 3,5-epimerase
VVSTQVFLDARGSFSESYNRARFYALGIELDFVQDNQSISSKVGTIRGLHFQSPPAAQAKLVQVLRGRILDVAVDLRRSSPTYGKWVAEDLSAGDAKQLFIPVGFAHGFCTLQPDTHVFYKTSAHYSPENDRGIAWNDPDLAIEWPISQGRIILSDKDARMPPFKSLEPYFE